MSCTTVVVGDGLELEVLTLVPIAPIAPITTSAQTTSTTMPSGRLKNGFACLAGGGGGRGGSLPLASGAHPSTS